MAALFKMGTVTVVNYGVGNVEAFAHVYRRLNIGVKVAVTPEQLADAEKVILPGVGAFDWAMNRLNSSGLRNTLDTLVLGRQVPVLGVCVGMQMMAARSEEGVLPGLGWIDAEVVRFDLSDVSDTPLPLPHMGWNDVYPMSLDSLFRGIEGPRYYFLHSFCIALSQPADVLATAWYGGYFTAALACGHMFGTQFHPEKSHAWGIDLLRNFAEL